MAADGDRLPLPKVSRLQLSDKDPVLRPKHPRLVLWVPRSSGRGESIRRRLRYRYIGILVQSCYPDSTYNRSTREQGHSATQCHSSSCNECRTAFIHIGLRFSARTLQQRGRPRLSYGKIRAAIPDTVHFDKRNENAASIDNGDRARSMQFLCCLLGCFDCLLRARLADHLHRKGWVSCSNLARHEKRKQEEAGWTQKSFSRKRHFAIIAQPRLSRTDGCACRSPCPGDGTGGIQQGCRLLFCVQRMRARLVELVLELEADIVGLDGDKSLGDGVDPPLHLVLTKLVGCDCAIARVVVGEAGVPPDAGVDPFGEVEVMLVGAGLLRSALGMDEVRARDHELGGLAFAGVLVVGGLLLRSAAGMRAL